MSSFNICNSSKRIKLITNYYLLKNEKVYVISYWLLIKSIQFILLLALSGYYCVGITAQFIIIKIKNYIFC